MVYIPGGMGGLKGGGAMTGGADRVAEGGGRFNFGVPTIVFL